MQWRKQLGWRLASFSGVGLIALGAVGVALAAAPANKMSEIPLLPLIPNYPQCYTILMSVVIVDHLITLLAYLAGGLAVVFFLAGAFTWVTSGGSEEKVKRGRQIVLYVVIGLAVVMLAKAVTYQTIRILGGKTHTENELINTTPAGTPYEPGCLTKISSGSFWNTTTTPAATAPAAVTPNPAKTNQK